MGRQLEDHAGFYLLACRARQRSARVLQGCVYGNTDPMTDIPKILGHAAEGRLDLGALITRTVGLDGIDDAFADMSAGKGARTVVVP